MGIYITPIGNHNLNTLNIKILAEDLISRLAINIAYGYTGAKEHFELLGLPDRSDELIIIDEIIQNPTFKTDTLCDDFYLNKQLIQKFGLDILNEKKYWNYMYVEVPDIDDYTRICESKRVAFPEYELQFSDKDNIDSDWLFIHKENYVNYGSYYSKWGMFCEFFVNKYHRNKEGIKFFTEFRTALKVYSEKLGGTKMYYIADQVNDFEGVGEGEEFQYTWVALEKFIIHKTKNLLVDIPQFMTDKKYRRNFEKLKKYPLGMVDNFNDLK